MAFRYAAASLANGPFVDCHTFVPIWWRGENTLCEGTIKIFLNVRGRSSSGLDYESIIWEEWALTTYKMVGASQGV
jgi:hypothetical protein